MLAHIWTAQNWPNTILWPSGISKGRKWRRKSCALSLSKLWLCSNGNCCGAGTCRLLGTWFPPSLHVKVSSPIPILAFGYRFNAHYIRTPRLCVGIEPVRFQCEFRAYRVTFAILLASIRELMYLSIEHKRQRGDPRSHRLLRSKRLP